MPAQDKPTVSEIDPLYWESVITKYSWWYSEDRERTFVIGTIRYNQIGDETRWGPVSVEILELLKDEPALREWDTVVKWVQSGQLIKAKR